MSTAPASAVKMLLNKATVAGTSTDSPLYDLKNIKTFQAYVQGSGAVAAEINIEGSNFGLPGTWETLATISLTGTNIAHDGFPYDAPWGYIQATLVSISGTNAQAFAAMATEPEFKKGN